MRSWLLITMSLAVIAASPALGELRLENDPTEPLATTPVTVTVANEFPTACFQVCRVTASWVNATRYNIDWYIQEFSGICAPVITTLESEIALGTLEPADYLVTAYQFVTWPDGPCGVGPISGEAEATFHVSAAAPVPTVSSGGLVAMAALVLTVGVVLIHRRLAGASGTNGAIRTVGTGSFHSGMQ